MLFGKLLPREGNFFEMFNQHADHVVEAARAFSMLVTNYADLHVNFSLRAAGEAIGLFAPDGTLWAVELAKNGLLSGDVTHRGLAAELRRFEAIFRPLLEAGRDIVSIHLSAGISGTFTAAVDPADVTAHRDDFSPTPIRVINMSLGGPYSQLQHLEVDQADADCREHARQEVVHPQRERYDVVEVLLRGPAKRDLRHHRVQTDGGRLEQPQQKQGEQGLRQQRANAAQGGGQSPRAPERCVPKARSARRVHAPLRSRPSAAQMGRSASTCGQVSACRC